MLDDVAAQLIFERGTRQAGIVVRRDVLRGPLRLRYRFDLDVPVYDHRRAVTVEIPAHGAHIPVLIDGPECLRHRYSNGSLCMWYPGDPPEQQWTPADGLLALVRQVSEHAYCEARCRDGYAWPKPESPGKHPRPRDCGSCPRSTRTR